LQSINALLKQNDSTFPTDHAAVACEQFSQWVIEDKFSQGRPNWNLAGAQFVSDVAPFETMKLRMLNGSHSLLAYLGSLAKYETVSDCMLDANYVKLITHYMLLEAAPTLAMPANTDLKEYAESLLNRFRNDSLKHRTAQIAMDGSNKIPQRWLTGSSILLKRGQTPNTVALGIAAWVRYTSGVDEQGKSFTVDDPLADTFKTIHAHNSDTEALINTFLLTRVFNNNFANHPKFVEKITEFYRQLLDLGAKETIRQLVADLKNVGENFQ
jgi:fructuronate reductase